MALSKPVSQIIEETTNPLLVKHDSWGRIPIGEIAKIDNGFAFKSEAFNTQGEGMPLIRIRDVTRGETDTYYDGDYDEDFIVNHGDLLVGMDGDFNTARWTGRPALLNQRVCRIRLVSNLYDEGFLTHSLQPYLDEINKETSSVTVKHLSSKTVSEIPLPFPPLHEQRRIVARIEELFSRLAAGVAALRHAKAQLQRYRQSVLAAAVTGQLTQAWREQHPDTEPAAKLLESILSERRQNWRGRGKYEVPVKPEGVFEELPASWEPITFGHICQVQGGFAFKSNDFVSEGINLVKIASLRAGKVDLDHNPTYLPADYLAEYSRFALRKGDTLIAMSGATTGKMGVYESEDPALLNQRVGRFLPYTKTNVTAGFLSLLVEQIGDRVLKEAYGAAQPNISPTEIEEMQFPLPPLAEQHQIVAEVEARTTAIDHLAAELDRQITRSNRLRQSTLISAFSGRL